MPEKTIIQAQLFERRHPDYQAMKPHWDFVESTYRGGRSWFGPNIFKYIKEGDKEFADRLDRAYRFNHTREVVDLITKYVFKGMILRAGDTPDVVKAFWKKATKRGADMDTLMREASRMSSIYGRPYIVVDTTARAPEEGGSVTVADEKKMAARVYAYLVKPQNVLDMSFDEAGDLNWILLYESKRDDANFLTDGFLDQDHFRLWTRNDWTLYRTVEVEAKGRGKKTELKVEIVDRGDHGLGVVPVIPVVDRETEEEYYAPGMVDDIAYLDRAVANYLSNLDAIIQDQTFSQLVIPAQNLMPGDDDYKKVLELGTKRIFVYDGEGGTGPEYISPDPKQAQIILSAITKIITEIYHTVGMAGERTKMDNAAGIDNSSGVAKAYDFDRMNTMLKAKADRLQDAENAIVRLVMAWNSQAEPERDFVSYPSEFDTRGLYDEFEIANRLSLLAAPDELRRHQMSVLVEKLFPQLPKDIKDKLMSELAAWPPEAPEVATPALIDRTKPVVENKQGQNNKDIKED